MLTDTGVLVQMILAVLLFPMYFQEAFLTFAWGAGDPFWIMMGKRTLLLLPVSAIIFACWLSVASLVTVIVRQNRKHFVTAVFLTWLDLGKAIVAFWGGFFKFFFYLIVALLALIKVVALGLWSIIIDILFTPFRLMRSGLSNVTNSQVPWIAVFLTLFWSIIEAVIFTYVTTPLVMDTFANITGEELGEYFIRVPLFIFMLFVILGSYAVLSNFVEVVKSKNIPQIIAIAVIEIVVMLVEVVFLYREFVDSLVPWIAQYSTDFEPGIWTILAIATFAWFGIRSLSWFLFAAAGTPTIMAIIQGKGNEVTGKTPAKTTQPAVDYGGVTSRFMARIKADADWVRDKSEELLGAFVLPPLQVIAAAINFCTLLVNGYHIFELPLSNIRSVTSSGKLVEQLAKGNDGMQRPVSSTK